MEKKTYPALGETVYRHTLPNGLRIVVIPRAGFTKKLAYFVTDYGAVHREFTCDGQHYVMPEGVAHFLEHKLFDMPDMDVSARFAQLGAAINAFTSYDMTAYYFSCTAHFEACLELLLQYVSTPYFTEESVQKEQGIIGQEIGMNEDNPDTRIFEDLMAAMYENHPIREPILGSRESIARITPPILELCHKAFYRPGNMLLCVVGDVDPDEVVGAAERVLPKEDTITVTRQKVWPEDMTPCKSFVSRSMEVAMPMFQLGFKSTCPEKGEPAVYQETVGDLAAEALFGESSPLYLRLYEEGLIDGSFGGGYETVDGMAMLTASGDSEDPEAVRDAILQQVEKLLAEGIGEKDFLRMKRSAMGRRIKDLDSFDSLCFRTCAYTLSDFDYFRFPEIYQQVTVEDVLNFLEQTVTKQRCCLSVIQPLEEE